MGISHKGKLRGFGHWFERDGDGFLSLEELRAFIERIVDPTPLLRALKVASIDEAPEALLKSLDIDRDGDQLIDIRRARERAPPSLSRT